jgi:hypothetical protein
MFRTSQPVLGGSQVCQKQLDTSRVEPLGYYNTGVAGIKRLLEAMLGAGARTQGLKPAPRPHLAEHGEVGGQRVCQQVSLQGQAHSLCLGVNEKDAGPQPLVGAVGERQASTTAAAIVRQRAQ